ncbi:MAG: TonB family protein, partial [Anditalea sp.]
YLWEGSICLLLLFGFYRIFLAKLTFFNWNRAYLILSLGIVLTIPIMSFQIDTSPDANPATGRLNYFLPEYEINPSLESPLPTVPIMSQIIIWIYITGLLVSLLRFFIGLNHIIGKIRSSEKNVHQGNTLLINPDFEHSSFFQYIFLPEFLPGNKDQLLIISHEQIHSKFFHTIDCLIFQLFRCIFWFHPLIKLVENSLYEIHEYQVDREITQSHSKAEYSHLLVNLIWTGGGKLVNNFNQFQIKNRIMMMAKEKSKLKEKFKFLLMLPLMGLLIVLFSCEQQEEAVPAPPPPPMEMEVYDVVENMPKPSGGLEGWNQYLANNLNYPSEAKEKGTTGTVYVTFVVDTEGSIQWVEILRGIGSGCDEEAIKTIKNAPKWEPGTQGGQKVNVKMRLPIRFGPKKATSDKDNIPMGEEVDQRKGELKVDANYANGVWSGIVRDPGGNVVPGATIVMAETSTGTVSDTNGRFSIETSQSGNLYASSAGYKSVRLKGK